MYPLCSHRTCYSPPTPQSHSGFSNCYLEITGGRFHDSFQYWAMSESCSTPRTKGSSSLLPVNCSEALINFWSEQKPGNRLQFCAAGTARAAVPQLLKGQGDLKQMLNRVSSVLENLGAVRQVQIHSIGHIHEWKHDLATTLLFSSADTSYPKYKLKFLINLRS